MTVLFKGFLSYPELLHWVKCREGKGQWTVLIGKPEARIEVPFEIRSSPDIDGRTIWVRGRRWDRNGAIGQQDCFLISERHTLGYVGLDDGGFALFRATRRGWHNDPIRQVASEFGIAQHRVIYSDLGVVARKTSSVGPFNFLPSSNSTEEVLRTVGLSPELLVVPLFAHLECLGSTATDLHDQYGATATYPVVAGILFKHYGIGSTQRSRP